jgi:thiol-disulfide isomerase/thioredoxin
MPRRFVTLTLLCSLAALTAVFAVAAQGQDAEKEPEKKDPESEVRQAPRVLDRRQWRISELIEDAAFTDVAGKEGKLSDYAGQTLVVFTTNTTCPLCKKFMPTLAEYETAYADKAKFLFVNVTEGETVEEANACIKAAGFKGRYVLDPKASIGKALRASTTTDCFVLDGSRTLQYRGAVDDQYGIGYMLDKPRMSYLKLALDSVLAGSQPLVQATWAPGCDLDLGLTELKAGGTVTWHNRVSRIIAQNCQECHRAGENGPFELMTYADVKAQKAMIKKVVKNRTMPPWFATPEVGHFRNDRSLTERDQQDLLNWIDGGMPEGDAKEGAKARTWPEGWLIGKPDVVLSIPEVNKVPAKGEVKYRYTRVETNFEEDRWVKAMEIRPSAPQVVHHVLVFLEYPKKHPRAKEQPNDMGGLGGYFMGMVPGQGHIVMPEGQAKFLPKGATMVFQIHYTTNGTAAEDQTKMALIFNDGPPSVEVTTKGIANTFFRIPAGDDNYKITSSWTVPKDIKILSFDPHAHVRGKAWKYEALYPDGTRELLIDIPHYDFNWQLLYELIEPKELPKGTKIICTAWYDNSDKNPANPDPSKDVYFGEQTWEEMMIGYVNYIPVK